MVREKGKTENAEARQRRRRWGNCGKVDQLANEQSSEEGRQRVHTRRRRGSLYAKLCNSTEYIKHVYKARRRRIHRAVEQSGPQLLRADAPATGEITKKKKNEKKIETVFPRVFVPLKSTRNRKTRRRE